MRKYLAALALPCLLLAVCSGNAADKTADPDEELLRQAGIAADDAGLLSYLRKYGERDNDLRNLDRLVRQLGGQKLAKRDEASAKLTALGLLALPALRKATKDPDLEIDRRSRKCIDEICSKNEWAWIGAAARILLKRTSPGTAEALLAVLPYAVDEATEETIWFGMDALAEGNAKGRSALVPALKDPFPARRALAACLLARLGTAEQKTAAQARLTDPDPTVRLRAAQGTLAAKDKRAIPVLIALLTEPAIEIAWQAEELLACVAGDSAPDAFIGAGETENRKRCHAAWEKWWAAKRNQLDLNKQQLSPCLLLLGEDGEEAQEGRFSLYLCGSNSKLRWSLKNLLKPSDQIPRFRLLRGGRVFLGTSERALNGQVLWKRDFDGLLASIRLPNGNTIFMSGHRIEELSPDGAVAVATTNPRAVGRLSLNHAQGLFSLPNGNILVVTNRPTDRWRAKEIDRKTLKVLSDMQLQVGRTGPTRFEICSDGHLIGASRALRDAPPGILEFDGDGRSLPERKFAGPIHAQKLPNGHIVCLGNIQPNNGAICELDRTGKLVWEALPEKLSFDRVQNCLGLVRLGFKGSASDLLTSIDYLAKGLQSPNLRFRGTALRRLAALGPKAEPILPLLHELIESKDKDLASRAASLFLDIGQPAIKHIPMLLARKDPKARGVALLAVSRNWPKTKMFLALVIEGLEDEDKLVRSSAAYSLRCIGPDAAKSAVPALIKGLRDKEPVVRHCCILALGKMGPESKEALPELIRILGDTKSDNRHSAAELLLALVPRDPATVRVFIGLLGDKDCTYSRVLGAESLGKIGNGAKTALPALTRLLNDPDELVRKAATEALSLINK